MVQKTIRLYLALSLITRLGISFVSSTYVIFLISRGLNLFEVNLVNSIFFATLFVFEVPTGVVADVFGRKISYLCSCACIAIGMFIYSVSYTFWGFMLAEFMAGIGFTFASGAFEAWMVDRVKQLGHTVSLARILAWEQQIRHGALLVGAIAGGYLADIHSALPWFVGGFTLTFAGILAAVCMQEEHFIRTSHTMKQGFTEMKRTLRASIAYGKRNKVVRFILVLGTVQYFAVQAPNMQWQPYFADFVGGNVWLGYIMAGVAMSMLGGAWLASRVTVTQENEQRLLILAQTAAGAGLLFTVLVGTLPPALGMFFLHEVARGFFEPVKNAYLNDNVPSSERATLISFGSVAHHLGGMAGLLVSGFVAQWFSISTAWTLSATVLIIGSLFFLWRNGKE